ncbi:collagen alpha-1(I) chain-like isoform X2 [Erinaceus europaeus]|uniref:Collagen alpha-1(I) chain-like isoform X2 n=1 Tax=Erinaceus europaeus TaxID=9365 RepID=A0ABM3W2J9_ERIEU|nr:collagen alpha-1(I) chain-like isoform X2 [Erinaceus europaeus]
MQFQRSGSKSLPSHLPGETSGVPGVAEGVPGSRRVEFRPMGTSVVSSRCAPPGSHSQSDAGPPGWVAGQRRWPWDSPSPGPAFAEGRSRPVGRPAASGVLETAEPGSRRHSRQQGAPQRPPHWPLGPWGPRTSAGQPQGPEIPRGWLRLPGDPEETPPPPAAVSGCKTHPPPPIFLLRLPSSRGRRAGSLAAGSQRQVGYRDSGGPEPRPPVTCEDSDSDLMIVPSRGGWHLPCFRIPSPRLDLRDRPRWRSRGFCGTARTMEIPGFFVLPLPPEKKILDHLKKQWQAR